MHSSTVFSRTARVCQSESPRATGLARGAPPRLLWLAAATVLLQACTTTVGSGIDYQSARSSEPLDVPPKLVSPDRSDRFVVPAVSGKTLSSYEKEQVKTGAVSRRSGVLPAVPDVTVERDGVYTWLRVALPPEEIWPVLLEFWQENGFVFAMESPETGILDTDWAENRARVPDDFLRNLMGKVLDSVYSLGERDRYRTRLERNGDGTTDIFVTHRGLVEVIASDKTDEQTKWQPRPNDPSLEAEFLKRLMLRFGESDTTALAAVDAPATAPAEVAATAPTPKDERLKIVDTAEGQRLQLPESFDRAWRNVGLALDRTGFTVEDRDRSIGTYFVRYIDSENPEQEQPGFFARMFGAEKPEEALQKYRIVVQEKTGLSEVAVLPPVGDKAFSVENAATAKRMLGLVRQQLLR